MDDSLKTSLDELQTAIAAFEADGELDDDERAQLGVMLDRLSALLDDGEEDGFTDHLEDAAIRFEGRHPQITAVIRSAVDTLTNFGI